MNPPLNMPAVLREESSQSPPPSPPPPPVDHVRVLLRWLPWLLTCLILIGILAAWLIVREPMEQLTPEKLAAARQKWREAGVRDYDLVAQMSTTAGRVDVQVRGGKVVELKVNGEPGSTGEPHSYTIEGLFDILERELEMSADPTSPLARQGKSFLRVRFDAKYGYPRRYLRVIGGSNQSNEMKILQFTPVIESGSN